EITGYSSKELLGKEFLELVHPEFRDAVIERAQARLRGEKLAPRFEVPIIAKNGDTRWLDYSATSMEYEKKPCLLVIAYDISIRKEAEEALKLFKALIDRSTDAIEVVDPE